MSERSETKAAVVGAVITGVLAVLQAFGLFILSDLRDRIMRLETQSMERRVSVSTVTK